MVRPKIYPMTIGSMVDSDYHEKSGGVLVPHWVIMRDSRVIPIARKIEEMSKSTGDFITRIFDYITSNVQYCFDSDCSGMAEYVQMPFETLMNGTGDCEDGSILMVSMLFPFGVPSYMSM